MSFATWRAQSWPWLFPLSQVLHAIEEYTQRYAFHEWLRDSANAQFSRQQTELVHMAYVVAMVIAVVIARKIRAAEWLLVALGVLILLNAASHVVGAIISPPAASGLLTSVTVWLPLGVFALASGRRHLSQAEFARGIVVGLIVQLPLTWLAAVAGGR